MTDDWISATSSTLSNTLILLIKTPLNLFFVCVLLRKLSEIVFIKFSVLLRGKRRDKSKIIITCQYHVLTILSAL